MTASIERVSIHGGHSGEFCNHAEDSLAAVVAAYIARGYAWVGLTEHMPPVNDTFCYPEEREAGLDAAQMRVRFARYVRTARRLQRIHAAELTLFVGMEVETYPGSIALARELAVEYELDYLLGSIHHVDAIPIDYNQAEYARAAAVAGGLTALYCRYFDQQYEMLVELAPAAVGHFDLIRIFDPDYTERLRNPEVWQRVVRNLTHMRDNGLILDVNLRALLKGAPDPYPCPSILHQAAELGLHVAPGDDSHGVDSVGACWAEGMAALQAAGVPLIWKRPA
ncbi:MAG: histidinol-phosphatase [Desulfosarcinaceae bacterium]|nr:histidinol-phosphatase [Desulfosarcinaceae bacterium]